MSLSTLRTRLETATEADQAEVLEMAFDVFVATQPYSICNPSWLAAVRQRLRDMFDSRAYESAALLIMREVLPRWALDRLSQSSIYPDQWITRVIEFARPAQVAAYEARKQIGQSSFEGRAQVASLAIIAAICAAKGDDES